MRRIRKLAAMSVGALSHAAPIMANDSSITALSLGCDRSGSGRAFAHAVAGGGLHDLSSIPRHRIVPTSPARRARGHKLTTSSGGGSRRARRSSGNIVRVDLDLAAAREYTLPR